MTIAIINNTPAKITFSIKGPIDEINITEMKAADALPNANKKALRLSTVPRGKCKMLEKEAAIAPANNDMLIA